VRKNSSIKGGKGKESLRYLKGNSGKPIQVSDLASGLILGSKALNIVLGGKCFLMFSMSLSLKEHIFGQETTCVSIKSLILVEDDRDIMKEFDTRI